MAINNNLLVDIQKKIEEKNEDEAKKLIINLAKSAGYSVENSPEYKELRDKWLADKERISGIENIDEVKRLAALGKDYESKNKSAEQKLTELDLAVKKYETENQKLRDDLLARTQANDAFIQSQIDVLFTGIDPKVKNETLSIISDLPKEKQILLIPKMLNKNTEQLPGIPVTAVPQPRNNTIKKVSEETVDSYMRTQGAPRGLSRLDVKECLEKGISFSEKEKQIKNQKRG